MSYIQAQFNIHYCEADGLVPTGEGKINSPLSLFSKCHPALETEDQMFLISDTQESESSGFLLIFGFALCV
jgi:hypothetical protein